MDPIYPWLDPIEVRRLADRLMRLDRDPARKVEPAGIHDGFVGFAAPAATTSSLPPLKNEALPAKVPSPLQTSRQEIQSHSQDSLLDQILRFRDWMKHHFLTTDLFLIDSNGTVIFDESHQSHWYFVARSLARAPRHRPSPFLGNVRLKIHGGATLEVIPVETQSGDLVLGAVVPESLSPPSVKAVMQALMNLATSPSNVSGDSVG